MAASDVAICNRALHKCGAGTIIALTDNTEKARVVSTAYTPVRQAELRRHRWRFSIKRVSLPALADAPDSDYARAFQLPNDCLRLIEGGDITTSTDLSDYRGGVGAEYSVEGRTILTNKSAPLSIRYIADITDVALFDAAFTESFTARLAMECAERLTESTAKKQELRQDYKDAIKEAIRANVLEVASEYPDDSEWVTARAQ